jgi:hypothetical protein
MFDFTNHCGKVEKFFEREELAAIVKRFKLYKVTYTSVGGERNQCRGIDAKHPDFKWFDKTVFSRIKEYTGKDNIYPIFGMYTDLVEPFEIHQDLKYLPEDANGKHYASFLIPISVDNDINACPKSCTLVFGREPLEVPDTSIKDWHKLVGSHSIEKRQFHELSAKLQWGHGDLLWWDSQYWHSSIDHQAGGFTSKQMLVIHTYVI